MTKHLLVTALMIVGGAAHADERLAGIACRSVHLNYRAKDAAAFYNEVVVRKSAPGTYFAVCGWNEGYFGIQELGNGKKLFIFSVWDSASNDPNQQADSQRVRLVTKDEKTRIGRFGGEGSGGQSFFDVEWPLERPIRLLLTAKAAGERIEYAGYFKLPEANSWIHMVTFSAVKQRQQLGGYYSFVEDFKRNRESTKRQRRAEFGNGWLRGADGTWTPLISARFTADKNPATNIDAGIAGRYFYLATGGETKNDATKLKGIVDLANDMANTPPLDLPIELQKTSRSTPSR